MVHVQPVLGFYDGREPELPYDMDDVLAEASAPVLIYQQDLDRGADASAVRRAVTRAKAQGAAVTLQTEPTVNMLNDAAHAAVIEWLQKLVRSNQNTNSNSDHWKSV